MWDAICQQCAGYEKGGTGIAAKRFVRTHNKSCLANWSQELSTAFNESLTATQESDDE